MCVGGGGLGEGGSGGAVLIFPIYLYRKSSAKKHWTNFNIVWQKYSLGDSLSKLSSHLDSSKNMAARGRGLFSQYICIDNFKNLLDS